MPGSLPELSSLVAFIGGHVSGFPGLTFWLFVLGAVVVAIAVGLILYSLKRKPIKIAAKKKPKKIFSVPPIGGAITRYLIERGWIVVNSLSQLFLKGLEFIESKLGENAVYRLPWYLVVGTKESGKSTLCERIPLIRPFGEMDPAFPEASPLIKWHMFTKAVVIDVAGRIFLNNPLLETDTDSFRNLLILLAKYRVAKPIDGIVLCIGAGELYGKDKLSSDELQSRAAALLDKIIQTQVGLRLRLPVYVMVTGCDAIAGFNSFAGELPKKNRESVFGWSSPYSLRHAFSPSWLEEAFVSLNENLEDLRLELLACEPMERAASSADGIFVFAKEFAELEPHLSAYLNRVFHDSATHDAPILRGIYFTGSVNEPPLGSAYEETEPERRLEAHAKADVSLVFLKNLFDSKIFLETGIAKPLEGAIKSLNRGLNIIRDTTIGFVVVATYGLFHAYDNFTEKKERVLPALFKMNSLLRNVRRLKLDDTARGGALFDTYASQLPEITRELRESDLFSLLVPASWFSPLNKDLRESLRVAYREIVLKTIYVDLLLKARDLLRLRPVVSDRADSLTSLLNPLTCSEFLLLKKFVDGLETLNDMLFKFNNLKSASDSKDLDSLIGYTFASRLPIGFVEQYDAFKKTLNESSYPLIDLKPYERMARKTLSILYENFLNAVFSEKDSLTLPSRLRALVDALRARGKRQTMDVGALRTAANDLGAATVGWGDDKTTWMDDKIFAPGKEFDRLLGKIEESPLFDKAVTGYLVEQTAVAFAGFKKTLGDLNYSLYGTSTPNGARASSGILLLGKRLSEFFKRPFMAKPDGHSFTATIPGGKLVYWDFDLVRMAYDAVKDYDGFVSKELLDFPLSTRENIKISARLNLRRTVISTLGKAQTLVDSPKDATSNRADERLLRDQVNDLKSVTDQFSKLLELLKEDDVGKAFMELRDVLCAQAQWLLGRLDAYLDKLDLYEMTRDDFSWWDGKTPPALGAFAARDSDELKRYVTVWRRVLISTVDDFAKPIVDLLKNPVFDSADGRNEALIAKWVRLCDEIDAYGKKQPNNSLSSLENLLLKDMETWDYRFALKNISLREVKSPSGDYLPDIARHIKLKLLARAEVLARARAIANYEDLAEKFNKNFKNKFPFTGGDARDNTGEVNPVDLKRFFTAFKKYGGSAKAILDQIYQLGAFMKEPAEFLKNLETVREFFEDFLDDKAAEIPSFKFKINFRTARDREKGGNYVVDWYVKPDETTTIDKYDKKNEGSWSYGQPFTVGFKWPEGGNENMVRPENDGEQFALRVDKATAEFTYRNQWALLWLLRLQAAPKGAYSKEADPTPYVLKFSVPLSDQTYAILYDSIVLIKASKGKAPPKALTVPEFPIAMPPLPERVMELKDKPVLTEGLITAISFDDLLKSETASSDDDGTVDSDDESSYGSDDGEGENGESGDDGDASPDAEA